MSDLSFGGKALVEAGKQADRPTSADRARVLEALRGRLGDAALGMNLTHAPRGAGQVRTWRSKFAKWGLVGPTVLVTGALWFAPRIWQRPVTVVPTTAASAVNGAPQPTALVGSASPEVAPTAPHPASALVAGSASSRPVDSPRAARPRDSLAGEVALLSRAETELRAGRPGNALLALNEHQRKFPRGALAEERTAARIQALCALGRSDEADAQLKQLQHISPNSAHQERARQVCRDQRVAP